MVDQIVPSTNLSRYLRYFNNIRVIIVDRDPRDVYCLEKYVWKDGMIPTDPKLFCKWFKYTRNNRDKELKNDRVKFVQFEDLVYKYNETVKELERWLELDVKDHIRKNTTFDPSMSKRNTKTWLKYENNEKENIKYIEEELSPFLYKY